MDKIFLEEIENAKKLDINEIERLANGAINTWIASLRNEDRGQDAHFMIEAHKARVAFRALGHKYGIVLALINRIKELEASLS